MASRAIRTRISKKRKLPSDVHIARDMEDTNSTFLHVTLGEVSCTTCCKLSNLHQQRDQLQADFNSVGKMSPDLMTRLEALRKSVRTEKKSALQEYRKLVKQKVKEAEETFLKQQAEATASLETELASTTSSANPVLQWTVHTVGGSILCQGSEKLNEVSNLHHITLAAIIEKVSDRMDEVAKETVHRLVAEQCFNWEAECVVTCRQNLYNEDDLDMDCGFEGVPSRSKLLRETENHCVDEPALVQFLSSGKRLLMSVLLKKENTSKSTASKSVFFKLAVNLHGVELCDHHQSNVEGRASAGRRPNSAQVAFEDTGALHTANWFRGRRIASGKFNLDFAFHSKEVRDTFLLMINGYASVLGEMDSLVWPPRWRRIWTLAQQLKPHLAGDAGKALDRIGKELGLEKWDELLKRPPGSVRSIKRRSQSKSGSSVSLPKGVRLTPTCGEVLQPLKDGTKLSQLMPHMQGDFATEFKLDLTLAVMPLKHKDYEQPW